MIDVLCRRTYAQRAQIATSYKAQYGKVRIRFDSSLNQDHLNLTKISFWKQDLLKNLLDETRGNFETLLNALMMSPLQLAARDIKRACDVSDKPSWFILPETTASKVTKCFHFRDWEQMKPTSLVSAHLDAILSLDLKVRCFNSFVHQTEILCTKSNHEMIDLKNTYKQSKLPRNQSR